MPLLPLAEAKGPPLALYNRRQKGPDGRWQQGRVSANIQAMIQPAGSWIAGNWKHLGLQQKLGSFLGIRWFGPWVTLPNDSDPEGPATPELGREVAEIGIRLMDDAYMAWFTAAKDSEQALQAWAAQGHQADAYSAYRAALDREEAAAGDFQRLSELARPCEDALATK